MPGFGVIAWTGIPMGRPRSESLYADKRPEILERLALGESLRGICRRDGMPPESLVRRWVIEDEPFGAQYARAKDLGLDSLADEIIEISNTPVEGVVQTTRADGGIEEKRGDMLEHRKLQVDARKWYLSKLAPKRYGDKQTMEHTGQVTIQASRADEDL